jgi:DNA sulfur modification protein DndC
MPDNLVEALDVSIEALERRPDSRWIIGYSGGKDSTATLRILLAAHKKARRKPSRFEVVYCDTGVENPALDNYVKDTIHRMQEEIKAHGLPLTCNVVSAPTHERFFVRIIGRGYPPPTNNFRWCTNSLRIRPVSNYIRANNTGDVVLALGLRASESAQRDRSMSQQEDLFWQRQLEINGSYKIFAPIVKLTVPEVWDTVFFLDKPKAIEAKALEELYTDASGECPIIKSPQAAPCASGRFGCWTCTVVRKDKSANQLISAGHNGLLPYLRFRDWLVEMRNDPSKRWAKRRNGTDGLGPFTMEARHEILARLDKLEQQTGSPILSAGERGCIAALWKLDHVPRLSFPKMRTTDNPTPTPTNPANTPP